MMTGCNAQRAQGLHACSTSCSCSFPSKNRDVKYHTSHFRVVSAVVSVVVSAPALSTRNRKNAKESVLALSWCTPTQERGLFHRRAQLCRIDARVGWASCMLPLTLAEE
jgi:hypothetical protein